MSTPRLRPIERLKFFVKHGIARGITTDPAREAILGQVDLPTRAALQSIKNLAGPFVDGEDGKSTRFRNDIVFVTSRFRSGSTALWNAFRQLEEITAFYEPFNERRFFDTVSRGDHVDPTHRGVDDYAREYDMTHGLDALYDQDWVRHSLYMDEQSWNPGMLRFIEILAESARSRPLLQFNRVDFRLPWLRANFPNASIVHLWRNPREQWCSVLGDIARFPCNAPASAFPDRFYQYTWVLDLQHVMPFFKDIRSVHPYRLFYLLWKTSWLFGRHYATTSIAYEELMKEPNRVLSELTELLGLRPNAAETMRTALMERSNERWKEYADADWFDEHERCCESMLDRFFGSSTLPASEDLYENTGYRTGTQTGSEKHR